MVTERAFGILVSRRRFLSKYICIKDRSDIVSIIIACCILQNLCKERTIVPAVRAKNPDQDTTVHAKSKIRRNNSNFYPPSTGDTTTINAILQYCSEQNLKKNID